MKDTPLLVSARTGADGLHIRSVDVRWLLVVLDLGVATLVSFFPVTIAAALGPVGVLVAAAGCGLVALVIARHAVSFVRIHAARDGELDVSDGLLGTKRTRLRAADVTQVFCREHSWLENANQRRPERRRGSGRRVRGVQLFAKTRDGRDHLLAAGVLSARNARCVERELESFLGLADVGIVGEMSKRAP